MQDPRLVAGVIGRPVHLQRPQAVIERRREVAGLVVDHGQQVQRPCQGDAELVRRELVVGGEGDRLGRQRERVFALCAVVRQQRELIERFGLEGLMIACTRDDACLEDEPLRGPGVGAAEASRIIEQLAHLACIGAQLFDRHPIHISVIGSVVIMTSALTDR